MKSYFHILHLVYFNPILPSLLFSNCCGLQTQLCRHIIWKYYLVDVGYPNRYGYLVQYKVQRYQSPEWRLHLMVSKSISTNCVHGKLNGQFFSRCHHIPWINKKWLLPLKCVFITSSMRMIHLMMISKDVIETQILCQPFRPDTRISLQMTHPLLELVLGTWIVLWWSSKSNLAVKMIALQAVHEILVIVWSLSYMYFEIY
jgi:hypothetical protein